MMYHTGEVGRGREGGEKKTLNKTGKQNKMEELSESAWCSSTILPSMGTLPLHPPAYVELLYSWI